MESSIKQNIWKLVFLECTMLTPVAIMIISLLDYGQLAMTIFLYNFFTMIILPAIYLKFVEKDPKKQKVSYYFRNRLEDPKRQIKIGMILFIVAYCLIVINHKICSYYFKKEVIDKINKGTDGSLWNLVFLVILLSVTNPFLEEWFWRNFIPQAIFDCLNQDYNNEKELINSNQNCQYIEFNTVDNNIDDENIKINNQLEEKLYYEQDYDQKLNKTKVNVEFFQLFITFHYAIYHFFVLIFITDVLYAVIVLIGILILGRFFLYLNSNVGYITNAIFHMGLDVGVCALGVIILQQYKIF